MAVKVLTKDNFDAETASGVSLVDFWASWCGPCRMMSPVVDGLSEKVERLNVCKVNVDDEPDLADRFGIDMIPALIFIKNGTEAHRFIGIASEDKLISAAKELL